MTMIFRDVEPGMCWRFTNKSAPDQRPTYTLTNEEAETNTPKLVLPAGWDDHYWEDPDGDDHSSFFQQHHQQPVQLLMHYSKAPEGRPAEEYQAVPAKKVRPPQWYIGGQWNEASAKAVASTLNRKEILTSTYKGDVLALDKGWAVVRTLPEKAAPFVANPPRILSCIDPFKDLSDAVFVLAEFHVDGLKGSECLVRFEKAQRTESIARTRTDPNAFVSTNAECGLTAAQVEHARLLWKATLKLKVVVRGVEDVERERTRVVVDYVDDL